MKTVKIPLKTIVWFALFTFAFILPWWALLVCVLASAFLFRSFFALVLIGLEMDLVYGSSLERGVPFLFTILILCVVVLLPLLKRNLAISSKRNY